MSKNPKKPVKLKYKPTQNLPTLKAVKEDWNLKKLFYTSDKDPQIEKDIVKTEKAYASFAKKYQSGRWTTSVNKIISALKEYEKLLILPGMKPAYYFNYRRELDAADTTAEKKLNVLDDRLTKMGNQLIFFDLQLAKIPKTLQRKLLADTNAARYVTHLKSVFADAQYQLSEPEEKILNLKSATSRGMWVAGTEKIINKRTITWQGKEMPVQGALMQFENLPWRERHQMWNKIKPVLEGVGEVVENELNALVSDKKVSDELRGYKNPYSATTQGYDSNDKTLEQLVSVIETRGYELSKRYFKLKKNYLGKELAYIDRNEPLAPLPVIKYDTAVTVVRDVFYEFNPTYGAIFDEMLTSGQIDVWPKTGKGGGAFCSSGVKEPTLVFLNHDNSLQSLRTLAHEMGHAIHAYRSKKQPTLYVGHSILTAETASTFFESLVAERLASTLPAEQQIAFLDAFICDKISTTIMCIARFKYELEMHETIRREGAMTFKDMSTGLAKHFSNFCGPAINMDWTDGFSVVSKPHYRLNFYQYTYSFGEIGSSIMRKRFKEDSSYKKQIDQFLCAGDSDSVEAIFKAIGINMASESAYHEGLDLLEAEIDTLTALIKATTK